MTADTAPITVDLDTKVRAHVTLSTFTPIPGVDMFDLATVVAFLADLQTSDREAVLRAAGRVAEQLAGCPTCGEIPTPHGRIAHRPDSPCTTDYRAI